MVEELVAEVVEAVELKRWICRRMMVGIGERLDEQIELVESKCRMQECVVTMASIINEITAAPDAAVAAERVAAAAAADSMVLYDEVADTLRGPAEAREAEAWVLQQVPARVGDAKTTKRQLREMRKSKKQRQQEEKQLQQKQGQQRRRQADGQEEEEDTRVDTRGLMRQVYFKGASKLLKSSSAPTSEYARVGSVDFKGGMGNSNQKNDSGESGGFGSLFGGFGNAFGSASRSAAVLAQPGLVAPMVALLDSNSTAAQAEGCRAVALSAKASEARRQALLLPAAAGQSSLSLMSKGPASTGVVQCLVSLLLDHSETSNRRRRDRAARARARANGEDGGCKGVAARTRAEAETAAAEARELEEEEASLNVRSQAANALAVLSLDPLAAEVVLRRRVGRVCACEWDTRPFTRAGAAHALVTLLLDPAFTSMSIANVTERPLPPPQKQMVVPSREAGGDEAADEEWRAPLREKMASLFAIDNLQRQLVARGNVFKALGQMAWDAETCLMLCRGEEEGGLGLVAIVVEEMVEITTRLKPYEEIVAERRAEEEAAAKIERSATLIQGRFRCLGASREVQGRREVREKELEVIRAEEERKRQDQEQQGGQQAEQQAEQQVEQQAGGNAEGTAGRKSSMFGRKRNSESAGRKSVADAIQVAGEEIDKEKGEEKPAEEKAGEDKFNKEKPDKGAGEEKWEGEGDTVEKPENDKEKAKDKLRDQSGNALADGAPPALEANREEQHVGNDPADAEEKKEAEEMAAEEEGEKEAEDAGDTAAEDTLASAVAPAPDEPFDPLHLRQEAGEPTDGAEGDEGVDAEVGAGDRMGAADGADGASGAAVEETQATRKASRKRSSVSARKDSRKRSNVPRRSSIVGAIGRRISIFGGRKTSADPAAASKRDSVAIIQELPQEQILEAAIQRALQRARMAVRAAKVAEMSAVAAAGGELLTEEELAQKLAELAKEEAVVYAKASVVLAWDLHAKAVVAWHKARAARAARWAAEKAMYAAAKAVHGADTAIEEALALKRRVEKEAQIRHSVLVLDAFCNIAREPTNLPLLAIGNKRTIESREEKTKYEDEDEEDEEEARQTDEGCSAAHALLSLLKRCPPPPAPTPPDPSMVAARVALSCARDIGLQAARAVGAVARLCSGKPHLTGAQWSQLEGIARKEIEDRDHARAMSGRDKNDASGDVGGVGYSFGEGCTDNEWIQLLLADGRFGRTAVGLRGRGGLLGVRAMGTLVETAGVAGLLAGMAAGQEALAGPSVARSMNLREPAETEADAMRMRARIVEACCYLAEDNISGTSSNAAGLVEHGAIPLLVRMLSIPHSSKIEPSQRNALRAAAALSAVEVDDEASLAQAKATFAALDLDGDGVLDETEVGAHFIAAAEGADGEIFNDDGKVDLSEFTDIGAHSVWEAIKTGNGKYPFPEKADSRHQLEGLPVSPAVVRIHTLMSTGTPLEREEANEAVQRLALSIEDGDEVALLLSCDENNDSLFRQFPMPDIQLA
jgi:hypothetical protein